MLLDCQQLPEGASPIHNRNITPTTQLENSSPSALHQPVVAGQPVAARLAVAVLESVPTLCFFLCSLIIFWVHTDIISVTKCSV